MPPINNGRKRRRRYSSKQGEQQRKEIKISFSPENSDSIHNSETGDDTETPIRLKFTRSQESNNYTISQTSTPKRNVSSSSNEDQYSQSPSESTQQSPEKINMGDKKPKLTDDEFKELVVTKLLTIEQRVTDLNKCISDLNDEVKANKEDMAKVKTTLTSQSASIEDIQRKQEAMESHISNPDSIKPTNRIVIKNLCQKGWDAQTIEAETNRLLQTLDRKAPDILTAKLIGNNNIIIVTLGKNHKIGDVLKVKRDLRKHKQYERVYIDVEKSITQQKAEASLRAIANVTPGLKFQRGQLQVEMGNQHKQRNTGTMESSIPTHTPMEVHTTALPSSAVNYANAIITLTTRADVHNSTEGVSEINDFNEITEDPEKPQ